MHVWNVLHAARWNTGRKKSPFWHNRTTLSGCIVAAEACIDNRKKLLNIDTSSTCLHNTVNFGLLTAAICWRVRGTLSNFNGFRVLAALLYGTLVVGVSQTAALNRGRHLHSTGRPSRWALAHILVTLCFSKGSAATRSRCGAMFNYCFITNLQLSLPMEEFW